MAEQNIQLHEAKRFSVKLIGIGGCGNNIVSHCMTDLQSKYQNEPALHFSSLIISANSEDNSIAFADREIVRNACTDGTQLVFVIAGLGGKRGTTFAPIVTQTVHQMNIPVVSIVTLPFTFEGKRVAHKAISAIPLLVETSDALYVIPNSLIAKQATEWDLSAFFNKIDIMAYDIICAITEYLAMGKIISVDLQKMSNGFEDEQQKYILNMVTKVVNKPINAIVTANTCPAVEDINADNTEEYLQKMYKIV